MPGIMVGARDIETAKKHGSYSCGVQSFGEDATWPVL